MVGLKKKIGFGDFAECSLKVNLFLDRDKTLKIINDNKIKLNEEAIGFIKLGNNGHGLYDSGCMEFDFKGPGYVDLKKSEEINKSIEFSEVTENKGINVKVCTVSVQHLVNY